MPNDIANRGCRTVPQIGWTVATPEAHACARSTQSNDEVEARDIDPQALGVNARCGCQNIGDQADWRLHLREFLQPAAARLDFGEQRPTGGTSPRMSLEAVELNTCQDAIKRVHEQAVKLLTLHSVTGLVVFSVIWHHITCL